MSKNYPFHKLSLEDWQVGAKSGLENAKEILAASNLCKQNDIFAVSNSLLITASEELIKAIYLRIRSVIGKEPFKGFQKLFFNHKEKHTQIMNLIILHYTIENKKFTNENKKTTLFAIVIAAVLASIIQSNQYKGSRNPFSIEESRLAGLYLDYDKSKMKWLIPKNEINIESFEEYFTLIESFFKKVETDYFGNNSEKNVVELYEQIRKAEIEIKS